MRTIPLTRGYVATISNKDFARINKKKWSANVTASGMVRAVRTQVVSGKKKYIYMHREVLNAPSKMEVDHRNHHTLDNTRGNLRLATRQQQLFNQLRCGRNTTGYKGVSADNVRKRFRVVVRKSGVYHFVGRFDSVIEAAKAYDKKARELFGEFACTNFGRAK